MICATCKADGKKSRVYIGWSRSTLMHFTPYYDENGAYHYHDRNTTTTDYSCSEGHQWSEGAKPKCASCDWPNGAPR